MNAPKRPGVIDPNCHVLSMENDALMHVCNSLIENKRYKDVERLLLDALVKHRIRKLDTKERDYQYSCCNMEAITVDGLVVLRELVELYKLVDNLIQNQRSAYQQSGTKPTESALLSVKSLQAQFPAHFSIGIAQDYFIACRRILSPDEPTIVQAGNDLAEMLNSIGKYKDAGSIYKFCLRRLEIDVGCDNIDTIASMEILARYYYEILDWEQCLILLLKTLKSYRRLKAKETITAADTSHNDLNFKIIKLDLLISEILNSRGHCVVATQFITERCNLLYQIYGDNHPSYLQARLDLAENYIDASNFADSETILNDCLDKQTMQLNSEAITNIPLCAARLSTMNDLAVLYDNIFDYPKSQSLYEECLSERKQYLGEQHLDTLQTMTNYGNMLIEIGKHDQAEKLFRDAIDLYVKSILQLPIGKLGETPYPLEVDLFQEMITTNSIHMPNHFDGLLTCVESLQSLFVGQGQATTASNCITSIIAQLLSGDNITERHRSILSLKCLQVKVLVDNTCELEYSIELCNELISIVMEKPPLIQNSHRKSDSMYFEELRFLENTQFQIRLLLAKAYHCCNLIVDEIKQLEIGLRLRWEYLHDEQQLSSLHNTNVVINSCIQFSKEETEYAIDEECQNLLELFRSSGDEAKYHQVQLQLLDLYMSQQEYTKAGELSTNCLRFCSLVFGDNNSNTLHLLEIQADCYRYTGMLHDAEKVFIRCFQICKSMYGEESPTTLGIMLKLAGLFNEVGDLKGAYDLYEVCFRVCTKLFEVTDIRSLTILNNMAICSSQLRQYSRAKTLFEKCISLGREHFGEDHDKVVEWKRDRDLYLQPSGCCILS